MPARTKQQRPGRSESPRETDFDTDKQPTLSKQLTKEDHGRSTEAVILTQSKHVDAVPVTQCWSHAGSLWRSLDFLQKQLMNKTLSPNYVNGA